MTVCRLSGFNSAKSSTFRNIGRAFSIIYEDGTGASGTAFTDTLGIAGKDYVILYEYLNFF